MKIWHGGPKKLIFNHKKLISNSISGFLKSLIKILPKKRKNEKNVHPALESSDGIKIWLNCKKKKIAYESYFHNFQNLGTFFAQRSRAVVLEGDSNAATAVAASYRSSRYPSQTLTPMICVLQRRRWTRVGIDDSTLIIHQSFWIISPTEFPTIVINRSGIFLTIWLI